jgi:CRP/FNR family transcriptional regulator, polysaccharide utilization system transcription regulator
MDLGAILQPSELEQLEKKQQAIALKKGETLFIESRQPSGVHYLRSGKMKLITTDAQGREQIIHLAKPGDLMGYRAVLGGDSYSCSAVALEDSETWFIEKETFLALLDHNAAFSHEVIRLLTAELRHAEHHLAGLARKPVKSRLAEALLLLAETYGFEPDGETLAVALTREEIAGLVGTATETAIRLLNNLKEEGMVATSGRKIRLLDRPALLRCSENA